MTSRRIKTNTIPLYVTAKNALIEMMKSEAFPDNRLPSEAALSIELGVSRATVREALAALIREGVVTKRHGLGNLIHRSTLESHFRIDKISDFRTMLEDAGCKVSVRKSPIKSVSSIREYDFVKNYEFIKDKPDTDEEYILLERLYYSNGKPGIITQNLIRKAIMKPDYFEQKTEFKGEFSHLLNEYSKEEVANSICTIEAVKADTTTAGELAIDEGDPIIQWYQCFYSIYDNVISYTKISFHPTIIKLSLLQKWS